jgi:hypothetical protein
MVTGITSFLLFHPYSDFISSVSISLLITLSIIYLIRRFSSTSWGYYFFISLAGALGILLGGVLDFGSQALINLSSICSVKGNNPIDGFSTMITLAPWSHMGMWTGCTLALLIVQQCHRPKTNTFVKIIQHGYCFVGMFIGMWLVQSISFDKFLPEFLVTGMLWPIAQMWLGMTLGMLTALIICNPSSKNLLASKAIK